MSITRWFRNWRARQREREFDRGFGWAMTQYYHYKDPAYYIADVIYGGYSFRENSDFDAGALAALRITPEDFI